MLELLAGPILQTGAVGAMLIFMVKWIKAKDTKSYEMIEQQNAERKEMYIAHSELIQEVTRALVDKNNTDDKMATAVMKLTDELREINRILTLNHEIMLRLDRSNDAST